MSQSSGPPYASTIAGSGGVPSIIPDVPISAVFICLFICSAATNMTILQVNRRRGHKFAISGVLFGFSTARITTLVLRIVWANRQTNVRLALAANIFVNAGVLLLYIVNLLFAQRILRAKQPPLGWHGALRVAFRSAYACVVGSLVMIIVAVVLQAYTRDAHVRQVCRDLQLAASTFFLVVAAAPLLVLGLATLLPRHDDEESFGHGGHASKTAIVGLSSLLCVTIAGFKTGATWMPPRPVADPAWYQSKPAFYVFVFTLEIVTVGLLTLSRVDKRFHVPDGSKRPGDYSASLNSSDGYSRKEDAASGF